MLRFIICILLLIPFSTFALDITEPKISGKWSVDGIVMGSHGELPAGEGDFFEFENGKLISAAQGNLSAAAYELTENQIIVSHPNKTEILTVTKLTEKNMTFFVNIFVNGKRIDAGNISFKLSRISSGN